MYRWFLYFAYLNLGDHRNLYGLSDHHLYKVIHAGIWVIYKKNAFIYNHLE